MWAFLLWFAVVASAAEPLWNGPGVNLLGGPSRDGKILSYVDPATRNLAIRDLATGQSRTLTQQKRGEYAYFSSISRDAGRVAYAWFNAEGFYELRVIGTDGANSQTIFRNEEAGFVQPCGWTPDDRYVLTLLFPERQHQPDRSGSGGRRTTEGPSVPDVGISQAHGPFARWQVHRVRLVCQGQCG